MKIDILCSDPIHPVVKYLQKWITDNATSHIIRLHYEISTLEGGSILFLVSCSQLVREQVRSKYTNVMVLHASDLPRGRGWSPHIWTILQGANNITVSLLSAADPFDTGDVWAKRNIVVSPDLLYDEINELLFEAETALMTHALDMIKVGERPQRQPEEGATYFPRRSPADSELDPAQSLADLFNLIRVSDPNRFPAFFSLHGRRYKLRIEKFDDEQ